MRRRGIWWMVAAAAAAVACGDGSGDASEAVEWLAEVETHGVDARHRASNPVVGGALLVADLDRDGRPDVVVGTGRGLRAYRNLGGLTFEDRTDPWGLTGVTATALGLADVDRDGQPDLLAASVEGVRLFVGTSSGFVERSDEAGLGSVEISMPVHVLAADLDRDGLVDFHLSSYGGRNLVLRARGDGTFEDVAGLWGMDAAGHTWTASWFDQNGDGASDLYLATDTFEEDLEGGPEWSEDRRAPGDLLYRNGGWADGGAAAFDEVSAAIRLDTPRSSMGGLVTDLDEDGTIDLFISDYGRNHALSPGADGVFEYRTAELGLGGFQRDDIEGCPPPPSPEPTTRCALVSWGAFHRDFDGDGYADLLVVNGGLERDERGPQPLSAYRGIPEGLSEVRLSTGPIFARAAVATDLDGDGDPDLVVIEWNGPVRVFENVTSGGDRLVVGLRGPAGARGAGSLVTVDGPGGARARAAAFGGLPQAHAPGMVSLRAPPEGSTVEVTWPTGVVQRAEAPAAGWSMRLEHPPLLEVDRRVLPADGVSEVEVLVHSTDDPGSVTVELPTLVPPVNAEPTGDGTFRAVLTAPSAPTRATLLAHIDGTPLLLRPHLIFE